MSRVLVVFASLFGANAQLSTLVEAALKSAGAEVRVRRVQSVALVEAEQPAAETAPVVTGDDLAWADGFVFTSPSHTGLLSASMKAFIDEHHTAAVDGKFLNTTFTAMATSGFAHAGQERVVDDLNAVAAAWGCLLVPPSTANPEINTQNGNPYGLSFVLEHGKIADLERAAEVIEAHLDRFVEVTDATAELRSNSDTPTSGGIPRRDTIVDVFG